MNARVRARKIALRIWLIRLAWVVWPAAFIIDRLAHAFGICLGVH